MLEVDTRRLGHDLRGALLARDRVLGIVAHDLRNPLNTIALGAQLLRDGAFEGPERERQLDVILRSVERMNRLIQDLLDVTRIDANALLLEQEPHAAAMIAREAVELNAGLAADRRIALTLDADHELPAISCDRDRVLQVLGNLIGNALKFTAVGGRIQLAVVRGDGAVRFSVSDDGAGMSEADLRDLFRPFWQTRSTSHRGAGLGLAIARGIVEAHGGEIWAESVAGVGSTFHFTIPCVSPGCCVLAEVTIAR